MNPLLDKEFLYELDLKRNRETYVKITLLTFDEQPQTCIEGRVTGGSINVDGNSVVRRSCSLSLITQDMNVNEYYWTLKSKIKIEIGLKNDINSNYPEIIWFNQGIYVLTSFNISLNTKNATINLSGKDKGCLLNGDIAGSINAETDFGKEEIITYTYSVKSGITIDNFQSRKYYVKTQVNNVTADTFMNYFVFESSGHYIPAVEYNADVEYYSFTFDTNAYSTNTEYYIKNIEREFKQIKLKDIIQDSVHTFAGEPYSNIEINDLENYGLNLIQYAGDSAVYLFMDAISTDVNDILGLTIDGTKICYESVDDNIGFAISNFYSNPSNYIPYIPNSLQDTVLPKQIYVTNGSGNKIGPYYVIVYTYGEAVGYECTDLVYPGELIANIGESLSSILDKIKNMLGDFEYFYDIDGKFIFQQKKTYIDTSWSPIMKTEDGETDINIDSSAITYSFEGNALISAIQNTPAISNVKNDFSIWGVRKSLAGEEIPIHLRYAIQQKPVEYVNYEGIHFTVDGATYEQTIQNARNEIESKTQGYTRVAPNSSFVRNGHLTLSDDWWEISDWAEYYKTIFGTYPSGWIGDYANEGKIDNFEIKIGNYFDIASSGSYSRYTTNQSFSLYVFDIEYTDDPDKPYTIGYTGHGKYCGHSYSYFLERAREGIGTSFIYKPKLPEQDVEDYVAHEAEEYISTHINMKSGLDWREVLYQMAIDYYKNNQKEDFIPTLIKNNKDIYGNSRYPLGKTGYEQYYADIQGFWRQLYTPSPENEIEYTYMDGNYSEVKKYITYTRTTDTSKVSGKVYYKGVVYSGNDFVNGDRFTLDLTTNTYVKTSDTSRQEDKIYYTIAQATNSDTVIETLYEPKQYIVNDYAYQASKLATATCKYYIANSSQPALPVTWGNGTENAQIEYNRIFVSDLERIGWSRTLYEDPGAINFWIDFLDTGELEKFSVEAIGQRPKVVNENTVKAIYYKETPSVIYVQPEENPNQIERKDGYRYYHLTSNLTQMFNISSQGVSAKAKLDELLYQYAYCAESISLTAIPVYYLQPNTRIFIHDDETNIDGDYLIDKLTIPLGYNGTMSISASKAPSRLY